MGKPHKQSYERQSCVPDLPRSWAPPVAVTADHTCGGFPRAPLPGLTRPLGARRAAPHHCCTLPGESLLARSLARGLAHPRCALRLYKSSQACIALLHPLPIMCWLARQHGVVVPSDLFACALACLFALRPIAHFLAYAAHLFAHAAPASLRAQQVHVLNAMHLLCCRHKG